MVNERIASTPPSIPVGKQCATSRAAVADESSIPNPATAAQPSAAGPSIPRQPEARAWGVALVLGIALVLAVGSLISNAGAPKDSGHHATANTPSRRLDDKAGQPAVAGFAELLHQSSNPERRDYKAASQSVVPSAEAKPSRARESNARSVAALGEPCTAVSVSVGQSKHASDNGLSYETPIPRPTVKGYYEPKVVPYPEGKPVYVNGYYRKDGTYTRPHFRSLPRR